MRISRILPSALAALLCITLYVGHASSTPESNAHGTVTNPMGGPLANLPLCGSEAGEGQALCVWEAGTQGNGEGTTIISGDCAPTYVGDNATMQLCMSLYGMDEYSGMDVQTCNDEYIPNTVELKKCYTRFMQ